MRLQTAKLRARLGGAADFHFINGWLKTRAFDPAVEKRFGGEENHFFSWYDVVHDDISGRPYEESLLDERGVAFRYPGADEAIERLDGYVDGPDGPFDALLGFSQGAILITMLSARRLKRAREGVGPPPSWRSNVLICGMPVRAEGLRRELGLDETPLEFPCTIAQGTSDPFYPWARRVDEHYVAPTTVSYDEGHRFPHDRQATAALAESILVNLRIADAVADEET